MRRRGGGASCSGLAPQPGGIWGAGRLSVWLCVALCLWSGTPLVRGVVPAASPSPAPPFWSVGLYAAGSVVTRQKPDGRRGLTSLSSPNSAPGAATCRLPSTDDIAFPSRELRTRFVDTGRSSIRAAPFAREGSLAMVGDTLFYVDGTSLLALRLAGLSIMFNDFAVLNAIVNPMWGLSFSDRGLPLVLQYLTPVVEHSVRLVTNPIQPRQLASDGAAVVWVDGAPGAPSVVHLYWSATATLSVPSAGAAAAAALAGAPFSELAPSVFAKFLITTRFYSASNASSVWLHDLVVDSAEQLHPFGLPSQPSSAAQRRRQYFGAALSPRGTVVGPASINATATATSSVSPPAVAVWLSTLEPLTLAPAVSGGGLGGELELVPANATVRASGAWLETLRVHFLALPSRSYFSLLHADWAYGNYTQVSRNT